MKSTMRNSLVWRAFQLSAGVLIAVFAAAIILVVLIYGIAWSHDQILSSLYDKAPAYDTDFAWGPYSISIDTKNTQIDPALPARTVSCYSTPSSFLSYNAYAYPDKDTSNPKCTATAPAFPGNSDMTAKLRVKNRMWLRTNKFEIGIITANFDGKTTSVSLKGIDNGQFFSPGKGGSGSLEASYSVPAEGNFVLTRGTNKIILH